MKLHRAWIFCVFALLAPFAAQAADIARQNTLVPWSDDALKQAKASNRYVLLHLGGLWCRWLASGDRAPRGLLVPARRQAGAYRRAEQWDPAEGKPLAAGK